MSRAATASQCRDARCGEKSWGWKRCRTRKRIRRPDRRANAGATELIISVKVVLANSTMRVARPQQDQAKPFGSAIPISTSGCDGTASGVEMA